MGVILISIIRLSARELLVVVARIKVRRENELPDVALAHRAARTLLGTAQRRKQNRAEDRDDRDDNQ
jgi:hypothetical protein